MALKIKLLSSESELLYEFELEDIEKAYSKAKELEGMGIEVRLVKPSLPASLGASLGMSSEDQEVLKSEIESEIESHNEGPTCGGCE